MKLVEEVLGAFKEIKLKETGQPNALALWLENLRQSVQGRSFFTEEKLNIEKIQGMLKWAMESHRVKGAD